MSFDNVDPDMDEVFVSGLPTDVTEEQLAEYFGQIGIIKEVRPVWGDNHHRMAPHARPSPPPAG